MLFRSVGEVIEPGRSEPLPLNIPAAQARFFSGVCRSGGRVITLLNTVEILSGRASITEPEGPFS